MRFPPVATYQPRSAFQLVQCGILQIVLISPDSTSLTCSYSVCVHLISMFIQELMDFLIICDPFFVISAIGP